MTSNPRQLEPISFPKIGVNNNNLKSIDNNNLKVKRPNNFSNTANIFFSQNKKVKNFCSQNVKDYKPKKIKINSEKPDTIEEEIDTNQNAKPNPEGNPVNNNNDSFINELEVLLTNVNPKEQDEDAHSVDEDTPDPRINFDHINDINKCRPQTSYGGLNQRRHKLQVALRTANVKDKNKIKYGTQLNFMPHPFDNNNLNNDV